MKKLTEVDKLKYWIDAEITIMHAMFAFIVMLLVESSLQRWLLGFYIFFCIVYAGSRVLYVNQYQKDYLRIPKK